MVRDAERAPPEGLDLILRCIAERCVSKMPLTRDDLDFAVDAVDDVEGSLEHLALVLGDGAVFAFGQDHAWGTRRSIP